MQVLMHAKLVIPAKLKPEFTKVRGAIERGDFYSADLKKLSGSDFFRARLDYDSRLLVRFVEYAGERACLALEVIEQHAYDRSRFLRGARVDEQAIVELPVATAPEIAGTAQKVRYLHPGRTEFHLLDKPLSFDDRQDELFRHPLPLVLVGCAGSGKTALTLTKLRELSGDVLYVTQSAYLAESAANLYFAHGFENERQNVDFLSYRALLDSIEVPRGRPATIKDFRALFKRHEQSLRFTTSHQLFEELRGVLGAHPAGPLGLEQYLALGVRQSIYGLEQRQIVHGLFLKYRAFLDESGLYDPNLVAHAYRAKVEPRYDAIVVDEVQDLTSAELALILALVKQRENFLLCGDANQIVHPNFFSWAAVKSWQKEARRLELQGKDEQAALIRDRVLRLAPVPWPVLDAREVRDLHQKAFAPKSIFNKAKQRLFEFAAYHGLGALAYRLQTDAQFTPPKPAEELARPLRERAMGHYTMDSAKVLQEVTRHGLEHRSMFGLTPLMMAADAGHIGLVETLLERGARRDATDSLGRLPVHFALRRAFQDPDFAREKLGPLFALLCPTSIDLEVDDKRLRLTKAQGEFLLLLLLGARFHDLYAGMRRYRGFQTAHVDEQLLRAFPRSVIPEDRRRRVYWNGVLARAEVNSSYKPARKLWKREKQGHYVPSSVGIRIAGEEGKPDVYVPLDRLLAVDLLEAAEHATDALAPRV